jgi:hypothetical protein
LGGLSLLDTTPSALLIKAFGGIDFLVATRFVCLSLRPVKSIGPLAAR